MSLPDREADEKIVFIGEMPSNRRIDMSNLFVLKCAYEAVGINDDIIKQVGRTIHPGEAALFLLTSNEVADKVLPMPCLQVYSSNQQEIVK